MKKYGLATRGDKYEIVDFSADKAADAWAKAQTAPTEKRVLYDTLGDLICENLCIAKTRHVSQSPPLLFR